MSMVNPELDYDEYRRYSRHIILPEVGVDGQKKLKQARVLLIGTGGLGSPLALYLAAAGVGTIGLVDFDVVDESNLQRQIIHSVETVGKSKVQSAAGRLRSLNPSVNVEVYDEPLNTDNALELIKQYDIVCDGTDNFQTRYLVNDACALLGIPNVYGSIFQFEGQVSVFDAKRGPCYRCLYPKPPPPGLVPSCAVGGVLGVLPGTIGTLQATEVVKLILGIGEPLVGRLLLYDALDMQFREMKLRKRKDCELCGEHPSIKELVDYDAFCGLSEQDAELIAESELMTVQELYELRRSGKEHVLIDVRTKNEREINLIEGSVHIPENIIEFQAESLPKDKLIVLQCKSGIRSARALVKLKKLGFTNLKNLVGGINAWIDNIEPDMPVY